MIGLADTIDRRYKSVLSALEEGVADPTLRSQLMEMQYQLETVKELMGPIHLLAGQSAPLERVQGGVSNQDIEEGINLFTLGDQ